MTYIQFLLLFVGVPLALLMWRLRHYIRRIHLVMLVGLGTIAIVYTTPWDNYLVYTRVWFYDPKLVLNLTLGYVPLEEYAFFILQTLLTGMFCIWLWQRFYRQDRQ